MWTINQKYQVLYLRSMRLAKGSRESGSSANQVLQSGPQPVGTKAQSCAVPRSCPSSSDAELTDCAQSGGGRPHSGERWPQSTLTTECSGVRAERTLCQSLRSYSSSRKGVRWPQKDFERDFLCQCLIFTSSQLA